jgi:hypothetical protein
MDAYFKQQKSWKYPFSKTAVHWHHTVSGRLNAGIAGSHLAVSVNVSTQVCVLHCDGTDLKTDWQLVFSRLFSVQTALILYFTTVA